MFVDEDWEKQYTDRNKIIRNNSRFGGEWLQKEKAMGYYFGKQDMQNLSRAQERCVLLTNGLGDMLRLYLPVRSIAAIRAFWLER